MILILEGDKPSAIPRFVSFALKMPNFSRIHEKAFKRMESLNDYVERKRTRTRSSNEQEAAVSLTLLFLINHLHNIKFVARLTQCDENTSTPKIHSDTSFIIKVNK